MPRKVHILGGGLAGLSAGADLARNGVSVEVIEAESRVGGLARSFEIDGFTCDLGPHRFHSNSDDIVDHIRAPLAGNLHMRDRLSRIFMFGKFFHYPLRAGNVLRNLPPLLLVRSFLDYWFMYVRLRFRPLPDDSFENYVRKRFGNTLYRLFFGTYTEKAWGIPPSRISPDWASQRITLLNLWDVVKKTLFRPRDVPRTYVSRFYYPKTGGIGAICEGYQRLIEEHAGTVLTSASVQSIQTEGDRVVAVRYEQNGKEVVQPVTELVSTIPVNRLVECLDPPAPAEILAAAGKLQHKAILFVYLMLDREQVTPDHWVYLPEKHLTVHRISEFKNFSAETCPAGKTLVCAEITCNQGDERWQMADQELAEIARSDLVKMGLFRPEEVYDHHVRRVPYSYPLYEIGYRDHLTELLRYLKRFKNLISTGRQGLFRYGNMDHSVMQGVVYPKGDPVLATLQKVCFASILPGPSSYVD